MIIFTLDALADDSHRRHLIDPNKDTDVQFDSSLNNYVGGWIKNGNPWQPNYPAYYDACDGDTVNESLHKILWAILHESQHEIEIWSSTCESVREKTETWLYDYYSIVIHEERYGGTILKMRPIGDDRPQEELFQSWFNEQCSDLMLGIIEDRDPIEHNIEMVFSSHGPTIDMFRRMCVFVFDCNQGK